MTILNREIKNCLLDYIANYKIKINDKFEYINNAIDKIIDWIINNSFNENYISFDFSIDLINNEK